MNATPTDLSPALSAHAGDECRGSVGGNVLATHVDADGREVRLEDRTANARAGGVRHIRTLHHVKAIACSECFHDQGLRLDAQRLGVTDSTACPNCGATIGRKLNSDRLAALASRFFVGDLCCAANMARLPRSNGRRQALPCLRGLKLT